MSLIKIIIIIIIIIITKFWSVEVRQSRRGHSDRLSLLCLYLVSAAATLDTFCENGVTNADNAGLVFRIFVRKGPQTLIMPVGY